MVAETAFEIPDLLDETYEELLLGLCVRDRDFLSRARAVLKVDYFHGPLYRALCLSLFTFWDTYRELPTQEELANETCLRAPNEGLKIHYAEAARSLAKTSPFVFCCNAAACSLSRKTGELLASGA